MNIFWLNSHPHTHALTRTRSHARAHISTHACTHACTHTCRDPNNHQPGVPVNMATFHFYASTSQRANITSYEDFFPLADVFLVEATEIVRIRDRLNSTVMLNVDETGIILPDDNDAKWTESAPGFPLLYWNAAAANYVYVWALMASIGVDIVGESQLTGYPTMP
jgi:hypothetical protein